MANIVVISGGLGSPSSTRVLGDDIVAQLTDALALRGEGLEARVVELRELGHPIVDAMLTGFPTGELAAVVESVASADALVVVSPTFSASISGLVKSFFDILEPDTLRGKPVLLYFSEGAGCGERRHPRRACLGRRRLRRAHRCGAGVSSPASAGDAELPASRG